MSKKIALVCPDAFSIWIFRQGLIRALMARDYSVYAITGKDQYVLKLREMGVKCITVSFERFLSLRNDVQLLFQLLKLFRREKFDIVHNFTIKANIYGSLMARFAGIHVIYNSVTGLGFLYKYQWETGLRIAIVKRCAAAFYYVACKIAIRTWFQNTDDIVYFSLRKLIHPERAVMIKSSGINLEFWNIKRISRQEQRHFRESIGINSSNILIIMVSRAIMAKGVFEFLEAADKMQIQFPNARFLLVGSTELTGHDGITTRELKDRMYKENSNFIWLDHRNDIPILLAASDICVLPSYYREGVPRNLLEGMAMEKPLVTTDSVGCRETVDDGVNGILIPPKNSDALVDALKKLCMDQELRIFMGRNSRLKVEKEFDEQAVVHNILRDLYRFPEFDRQEECTEKNREIFNAN